MNKIKFLYDVVKVMKDQDVLNGVATLEVLKDQAKIFYVKNQFQKNFLTMQTKATIATEIDYDGKEVKHQSTTEFTNYSHTGMHHKNFRSMNHNIARGGIKAKLNKLAFALHLLNNIQIEEQENKTTLITLEVSELPEELKTVIKEKVQLAQHHHTHGHHCFAKEFCTMEQGIFSLAMTVNGNYTVEKIVVTFDAIQSKEQNEPHVVNLVGNLQLTY